MRRTVTHDLELSGHELVEGDRMVLFYGAANRDPRVFRDPEVFDVRRDPNPHLGFGGPGPHFCLGAHLARREVAVMFRQLHTRLPDIEVDGSAVPLAALGIPLVGAGIKHLPVRFTPHRPGRLAPGGWHDPRADPPGRAAVRPPGRSPGGRFRPPGYSGGHAEGRSQKPARGPVLIPEGGEGVLPYSYLVRAIDDGVIDAGRFKIPTDNVQPASLDLRLQGEIALPP